MLGYVLLTSVLFFLTLGQYEMLRLNRKIREHPNLRVLQSFLEAYKRRQNILRC
ncbi:hypothetical protein M434DRAFT_395351 [Hypoxylon sp. CO27-5]|nr:hypothetical protein M434DRAFT_395351 [Hypoxylon sp. CO27-5]